MNQREAFILSNLSRVTGVCGIPQTAMQVALRQIEIGRQLGRTWDLIRSLPEDGNCVVMIHKSYHRFHFCQMIVNVRGVTYPFENVRFTTYEDYVKGDDSIRDLPPMPGYIDNSVFDALNLNFAESFITELLSPKGEESEPDDTPTESIIRGAQLLEELYGNQWAPTSTPSPKSTTTDGSEKSSSKSRRKSKKSARSTDGSSES